MAVQARQQFLQSPPLVCSSSNNNNGDSSNMGWVVDGGGGLLPPQQVGQVATETGFSSALASQHLGPMLPTGVVPPEFSYSVASQIDREKREMDQFLRLQSGRLRVALQQQMKQQLTSLMRTLEARASALLRHKEEELARASKRAAELEERLRRSEAESEAWQRMARESEAMAIALSSTLEQFRDNNAGLSSAAPNLADPPAASCCSSSSEPPGAAAGDGRGSEPGAWARLDEAPPAGRCRGCGVQDARVLFLPCMHLCACELCDALLAACPICGCVKEGSMEVFI